ncbi:MAG: SH3 domain-containing C40 family peptidase [Pseudomonadota bacterium]
MTEMAIDSKVYGANVRSSPRFGNNVVGFLNQCDPVRVVGPKQGDRWIPCRIQGQSNTVFISKNVLRRQVSAPRERLVRECVKQWLRFDKETGKEHRNPYHRFVGEFWDSIGLGHLDGTDRDTPWSAAFISFCVRKAGGYSGFKFSAAHSKYVNQSIVRKLNNQAGPYWGFRINEHKPQIGDMVCRKRTSANITYDFAAQNNAFKSHCDIVISIRDDHVSTIGGNISHTVSRVNYPLTTSGHLSASGRVYAVMKNML